MMSTPRILLALTLSLPLAGCNSSPAPAPAPAPQAPAAATVQPVSGQTLRAFSIQSAQGRQLTGYQRISPDLWSGPHPATGQVVSWSARSDAATLVLYTENPQITTMTIYIADASVASSALDGGGFLSYSEY